jgi:PAS domain S-box-containing protein
MTTPQDSWSLDGQSSIGLGRSLASVSMPRFLSIVVPLALLFAIGFVFEYRARVAADEVRFLTEETAVIQRGIRRLQREVESSRSDLFFVAEVVADSIDDGTPERRAALERSLLAFVRRRSGYAQVRYIGADGREALRIENALVGPRIVPESEMQDKTDREYFARTMQLEKGDVFVSRLELNVERGVLEEPFQPVVRLATPIGDGPERYGIVVLNAEGGRFLRAFEPSPEATGVQRMIVDSEGFWLRHRPEVEWGFALDHGNGFARSFPEVWSQMAAEGWGRIESSDGLFFFDTASLAIDPKDAKPEHDRELSWVLISWVPREVLDGITVPVATRLLVIAVPSLFGLLGIAWLVAGALERRRLADEALRSLERVRSVMMRAALDAIVVMDEAGTTIEFNPAAQRIFGYTSNEAIGKPVSELIIPPAHREAHRTGLARYLRTGEATIIDTHVEGLTGIRKGGEEFPVELTVCTMTVSGKHLFFGFLRDLDEASDEGDENDEAQAE